MNWPLLLILLHACMLMMLLEWRGLPTTLRLTFKGDVKRETAFLAQWGQSISTPLATLIVWQLDFPHRRNALIMLAAVSSTSVVCFLLKRLLGRVRPNKEGAGKFLGPSFGHASYRESFPSSHSACAITLSVFLAHLYAPAAITFIALGITTAILRYVLDAHFPSDVLGGVAIGYIAAICALHFAGLA
jgi:membrane-associated phospholipid phosphatase